MMCMKNSWVVGVVLLVAVSGCGGAYMPGEIDSVESAQTIIGACPSNLVAYRGQSGANVECFCSLAASQSGSVWGTASYTDDSSLCRAAVHAGKILAEGNVKAVIGGGLSSFTGSTHNGVPSFSYGSWPGSYSFSSVLPPGGDDSCNPTHTCAAGMGDCDSNADCDPGLTCVNDVGESFGFWRTTDVCMNLSSTCSTAAPCKHGVGPCTDDSQCAPGSTCVHNLGWNGSAVDVCVDFMRRPFNEYTWLATHNSYSNEVDNPYLLNWIGAVENQLPSVSQQMKDGVRGLLLDTHYTTILPDIFLCHKTCEANGFTKSFFHYLTDIKTFLDTNRSEVITIELEDYVKNSQIRDAFSAAGLTSYVFNPSENDITGRGWPTVREMITANRRLVILTDASGSTDNGYGILHQWDWTIENVYGSDSVDPSKVYQNRAASVSLNTTDTWRLFTMNHFPTYANSDHNNYYELSWFAHTRANYRPSLRLPSFVAVDYYNHGEAKSFVQDLETMKRYGIGFVSASASFNNGAVAAPNGYNRDPGDLNRGTGGSTPYIYLVTRGNSDQAPLKVIYGNSSDITCPPDHPNKFTTDLNKSAGGDYVYFCANADGQERTKVVSGANSDISCDSGWTRINQDLNYGAGGDYVYLCVR